VTHSNPDFVRRRLAAANAAALLATLFLPACGRKAPPKPPEFAAPRAISDLRATNVTDGVMLTWSRPREYADGTPLNSLGSFAVERAAAPGAEPFQTVATLKVTDRERFRQARTFHYLDRQPAIGSSYLYRVFSSTTDGYRSRPSNAVEITRRLPPPAAPTHERAKPTPAAR
jgi:hypothetical protein